ncbi:Uncharacterised protein [Vibrio cholerae]|nr:Uncharacterised protein [Vibrio cholerae]CSB73015.1 Uncharacterised protein [Vibrio cholerae]CSE03316.1 Uncharacterised protein [Vibrio cholerae]
MVSSRVCAAYENIWKPEVTWASCSWVAKEVNKL